MAAQAHHDDNPHDGDNTPSLGTLCLEDSACEGCAPVSPIIIFPFSYSHKQAGTRETTRAMHARCRYVTLFFLFLFPSTDHDLDHDHRHDLDHHPHLATTSTWTAKTVTTSATTTTTSTTTLTRPLPPQTGHHHRRDRVNSHHHFSHHHHHNDRDHALPRRRCTHTGPTPRP